MTHEDNDQRAVAVLARALCATSSTTRIRAVAMLACVECPLRLEWLERAASDDSLSVSDTAQAVLSWIAPEPTPRWPAREDPAFDVGAAAPVEGFDGFSAGELREWEYVVEVWRDDALLVGVFLAAINQEDDDHAKCIALGQAIMASAGSGQDPFEPSSAAAFIVGKRHVVRRSATRRRRRGEEG